MSGLGDVLRGRPGNGDLLPVKARRVVIGLAAWSVGAAAACGGTVVPSDAGLRDAAVDGAWTQCASPDGVQMCDGPNNCRECAEDKCDRILLSLTRVGVCLKPGNIDTRECIPGAADGEICASAVEPDAGTLYYSVPRNQGILLAQNGSGDIVRDGDMSSFTGQPPPDPASCPDLSPFKSCGGACGGCLSGERCIGRGALHPVGICRKQPEGGLCPHSGDCGVGEKCFSYLVQPDAQQGADYEGLCLASAQCDRIAKDLPGGGRCRP